MSVCVCVHMPVWCAFLHGGQGPWLCIAGPTAGLNSKFSKYQSVCCKVLLSAMP